MMLNSGEADTSIPLLAFTRCDDGKNTKVSIRASRNLSDSGLNLSEVMHDAAAAAGGIGGGHNIAAGAQIPIGKEKEFLEKVIKVLTA
jgi:RecJ-like exonuclease